MISLTRAAGNDCYEVANLAVGVVADGIEERRGKLDFERFGALDQIHQGRRRNGQVLEQLCGRWREFGLGFDEVGIGLGVFDQRRRSADFAGEKGRGFGGEASLRG